MADLLYLSYWLRDYGEANMLRWFGAALKLFPFSAATQGVSTLRVYAIEYAEPPLLETYYAGAADPVTILDAAREFRAADCAYLASCFWDLWQPDDGWKLSPAPAQVCCYGPDFQNDLGDHLRIELGLDFHFLPKPEDPSSTPRVKSNIASVLRLAKELDQILPVQKRRLWTESGEDFAERVQHILATG